MNPSNNLLTFTPGTIIQSAQVNQNFNDAVQLSGNSVGSQLQTLLSKNFSGFVQSGGIITTASGLTVNMSAAYVVVSGLTYYMPAQTFTVAANDDTYIDFVPGSIPTYQASPVSNNIASPNLYSSNSVRMGIVIAGASAINSVNQGSVSATAPVVNSATLNVVDTLGNLVYNTEPFPVTVGYRQITSNFTPGTTAQTACASLLTPCIIPTGRKARVKLWFGSGGSAGVMITYIFNGTGISGAQVAQGNLSSSNGMGDIEAILPLSYSGFQQFTPATSSTSGNPTIGASSTQVAYMSVELV